MTENTPASQTVRSPVIDPAVLQRYDSSGKSNPWRMAAYQKKKFRALEEGVTSLLSKKDDLAFDKLGRFYMNLGAIDKDIPPESQIAVLNEWIKASQGSHVPKIIRAVFHTQQAWKARGSGFANEISSEAAEEFKRYMTLAKEDLDLAIAINKRDPYAWSFRSHVAMCLNLTNEVADNFETAVGADPGNYLAYWFRLIYFRPQWFGSEAELTAFITGARNRVEQNPRLALFWLQAQSELKNRGAESQFSSVNLWEKANAWYQRAVTESPDDLVLRENYALTALWFEQYEVEAEQFDYVGDRWAPGSHWQDLETYSDRRARVYHRLGRYALESKQYAQAEKSFSKAVELGFPSSMVALGNLYSNGTGVGKDPANALALFQRAAELKSAEGLYRLGFAYGNGDGVPKDEVRAAQLYLESATAGFDMAQNNIGWAYLHGKGVPKNQKEAIKWFQMAAAQGQLLAMANLGSIYREGNGVPVDYAEALKWYKLAAAKGDAASMANVGWLYENGQGVTKDVAEAKKWYQLAAEKGSKWASQQLAK